MTGPEAWLKRKKMISVEQALDKVLSYVDILAAEPAPLLDCLGRVLAEDVYAGFDIPPLDNSAMDGFAVRSEDTRGADPASPKVLTVIDTVPAGSVPRREVAAGTAVRIMTGAPVPRGADTVVPFESTDETRAGRPSDKIGILCEAEPGGNIRRAGEDIRKGSLVLGRGALLMPAEIGLLASLGKSAASIYRTPVIAILATGDELVELGRPLPPGKIYNSNSYSVAALVKRYGATPKLLGIALDSEDSVVAGLKAGLEADMLITTGGVSAGDYDLVKDVLARQGEITFWTVRMKPGKPLAFGRIRAGKGGSARYIPHLGLPGNPVSSMITFEVFARPAILKMMGRNDLDKPSVTAVMEDALNNRDGRRVYARAVVERRNGGYYARLTGPQGSGILTSMARANALVVVPEDTPKVGPGDRVKAIILDWSEP